MPDAFQSLLQAILDDNQARVRELLKLNPVLVTVRATKPVLAKEIAHWIYAGDTALQIAAAGHRLEITKLLLAAGASVNSVGKHRHSQPLHYAADGYLENPSWNAERQVATIRLLLDAGADLHTQDKNGATPLHRAVRTRCAAAVRCLLAAGADATLRNKPGSTAFHLAVQNTGRGGSGSEPARVAQRKIIQALLEHDVSPSLKDVKGKTVLDWARSDWIRELLNHGEHGSART
ncbi:MAG: ankyrin repeat domain-containing protein [Verrucomicrobiota bacterium]